MQKPYKVTGAVELFPQAGGWYYVKVPQQHTEITKPLADRGLVAITVTLGELTWDTSLLPMGNGTHFIALPAKVRKPEKIELGQKVHLSFVLRSR